MHYIRRFYFIIAAILIGIFAIDNVQGQTGGSIGGAVISPEGIPLVNATVLVTDSAGGKLMLTTLSDADGRFHTSPVAPGIYLLKVSAPLYELYVSAPFSVFGSDLSLPAIKLAKTTKTLKEVTIRDTKPLIEIKADKLVLNVENSIVSAGSSALEILEHAPGVKVDGDERISLKGKAGVNVMIDGKIIPLSSAELASQLKAMPSDAISKIEIIANPSARYDAAGNAGIINILTRRSKKLGANAIITGNYILGVYPKAVGGFNFSYRGKKIDFYCNYSYAYRKGFMHMPLFRDFYENGSKVFSYNQDFNTITAYKINTGSIGCDYHLSANTIIGASVNGHIFRFDPDGLYNSNAMDADGRLSSYFITSNHSHEQRNNFSENLHMHHSFDTSGKSLDIDLDAADYHSQSSQDFNTCYFNPDGTIQRSSYFLHGDLSGVTNIRSLKADYAMPLKAGVQFTAGLKSSFVTADNEPLFFDRSNGGNVPDTSKSNHFIYHENINAIYMNVAKDWSNWSAQFGLRAEQTLVKGTQVVSGQAFDRNYIQLFPSLALQRKLSEQHKIGLTLSRRIDRPAYDQLNPFKLYLDPTEYDEGNPYLRPALTYAAECSYIYKERFITTFSWSVTKDIITEVIRADSANNKITAQVNVNLSRLYYYNLNFAYPFVITKWWSNTTNMDIYYSYYQGSFANTSLNRGGPSMDLNMVNSFKLPHQFSAEIALSYQAPQVYGFMDMKAYWALDAGIQKAFSNKRTTIRLKARDIFNTSDLRGTSHFVGYVQIFDTKRDSRQVALTISYRLGKRTVEAVRKNEGGAEDEKKRVGGAGG